MIGDRLTEVMEHNGESLASVAKTVNYSKQTISAWRKGARNIPKEVMPSLSSHFDDPGLCLELALVATNGMSLPLLDGDFIGDNSLSMIYLMQKETREALEKIDVQYLIKRPEFVTANDVQEIKNMIEEHLEAATAIVNEVGVLCKEYGISISSCYTRLHRTLKARRMRK